MKGRGHQHLFVVHAVRTEETEMHVGYTNRDTSIKTFVLYRCDCGAVKSDVLGGRWTLADLDGAVLR
jgi:hypothetical protein